MALKRNRLTQGLGLAVASIVLALLAAFVVLALLPASAESAYPPAIGRANLDGTGVDQTFISTSASSLAVDADYLYWIDPKANSIARANLDGTGLDQDFITDPFGSRVRPGGLALDSAHIYWGNGSSIGRANLDGTGVDKSFIDDVGGGISGVAVDGAHIYWAQSDWIGRANVNGAGVESNFIRASWDMRTPGDVAADPAHVYWSYSENYDVIAPVAPLDARRSEIEYHIGRANLDGTGAVQHFIYLDDYARELAVDPSYLYWASGDTVSRAQLDGSGYDDIISGAFGSGGVAVDSAHVYWTNSRRPGLKLGDPALHRRQGTASLPVKAPGSGELVLRGKGLHTVSERLKTAGKYRLAVKPKGAKERSLRQDGSVRVRAKVTFTLTGANPRTKSTSLKLVQREPVVREPFDARGGMYEGARRSGAEDVSFKVTKHDEVKNPSFNLILGSESYCYTSFGIRGRDKINHHGKFKLTDRHASFKGKFVSRTKVEGQAYGERQGCGSSTDSYTAHHR